MFIRCFYNTHECVHVYTQEVKGFKTVNRISPYLFLHFNISIVKVIVNFKLSPSSLKKKASKCKRVYKEMLTGRRGRPIGLRTQFVFGVSHSGGW